MLQYRNTPEGESRYCWSVDFAERRAVARAEMQPMRDEVEATKAELINLKELFKRLKRSKGDQADVEVLDEQIRELQVKAKNLEGKITDIDAAVFDLKADNPHIAAEKDTRKPIEIINDIKGQGEIIARALSRLEQLMSLS
jgi:type I restriction enzyme M protein